MSMNFVLKLDGMRIPNIKKIKRIPDIEKYTTQESGTLYGVKYFIYGVYDTIMIRISSTDKSFLEVHSIDVYDKKLRPGVIIKIKPMDQDKFIEFIGSVIGTTKFSKSRLKEDFINYKTSSQYMIETWYNESILKENPLGGLMNMLPGEVKYVGMLVSIVFAVPMIMKFGFYIKKLINWSKERYVAGPIEDRLNQDLFQNQTGTEPAFAIYDHLKLYILHIVNGQAPSLIIYGPPGMSKTYTVRRTLHFAGLKPLKDYSIEKGSGLNIQATYSLLYKNRKRLLILDDFDTPLQNPEMVNMLKAITDSYGRRILSLPREKTLANAETGGSESGVPDKFEFKGKLIIITNLDKSKLDPALLSRSPAIEVNFNSKEVLTSLELMYKYVNPSISDEIKKEVYEHIIKLYRINPNITIDFRAFKSAVDARVGCPEDWKNMTKIIVGF